MKPLEDGNRPAAKSISAWGSGTKGKASQAAGGKVRRLWSMHGDVPALGGMYACMGEGHGVGRACRAADELLEHSRAAERPRMQLNTGPPRAAGFTVPPTFMSSAQAQRSRGGTPTASTILLVTIAMPSPSPQFASTPVGPLCHAPTGAALPQRRAYLHERQQQIYCNRYHGRMGWRQQVSEWLASQMAWGGGWDDAWLAGLWCVVVCRSRLAFLRCWRRGCHRKEANPVPLPPSSLRIAHRGKVYTKGKRGKGFV